MVGVDGVGVEGLFWKSEGEDLEGRDSVIAIGDEEEGCGVVGEWGAEADAFVVGEGEGSGDFVEEGFGGVGRGGVVDADAEGREFEFEAKFAFEDEEGVIGEGAEVCDAGALETAEGFPCDGVWGIGELVGEGPWLGGGGA